MAEQSLSSQAADQSWLRRHWRFLLVGLLMLCAELGTAFRWGARGDQVVYWLYILDHSQPYLFCTAACLIGLAGVVLVLLTDDLDRHLRTALMVMYVLPLPWAFMGAVIPIAPKHYVTSARVSDHVYHLSYMELGERYYSLDQCDRFGFICHQVDYFPAPASDYPDQAQLTSGPGANSLLVVLNAWEVRQEPISGDGPPVGRWLKRP